MTPVPASIGRLELKKPLGAQRCEFLIASQCVQISHQSGAYDVEVRLVLREISGFTNARIYITPQEDAVGRLEPSQKLSDLLDITVSLGS